MRRPAFACIALLCIAVAVAASGCAGISNALKPVEGRDAVLTGWGIEPGMFAQARAAGFRQIIDFGCNPDLLAALVKEAREQHIRLFGCVHIVGMEPSQVMSDEENAFLKSLAADNSRDKGGYQWGGEPRLPLEALDQPLGCFHHESVREQVRGRIKSVLGVEGIAGVTLDFCGYRNYRCCRCPLSMQMAEAFRRTHPELTEAQALERFSRESLIAFYNEMADYAHTLKPGAVVACHLFPTFLPDIYYGNHTRLDECAQTVAWYFAPYWTKERIEAHVQQVCGSPAQAAAFNGPAAFIGVPTEFSSLPQKPVEQVEFELRTALQAGARRIHVCSTSNILRSPAYAELFKRIFTAPE